MQRPDVAASRAGAGPGGGAELLGRGDGLDGKPKVGGRLALLSDGRLRSAPRSTLMRWRALRWACSLWDWHGESTFCVPLPSAFFMAGLALDADALREAGGSSLVSSSMTAAEATLADDCLGLRAAGGAGAFGGGGGALGLRAAGGAGFGGGGGALMACPMPLPRYPVEKLVMAIGA